MLEDSIATESIYGFAPVAQQTDVPPSEESIFVLTASQLREIVSRAVLEATEPHVERIETLEATVCQPGGQSLCLGSHTRPPGRESAHPAPAYQ